MAHATPRRRRAAAPRTRRDVRAWGFTSAWAKGSAPPPRTTVGSVSGHASSTARPASRIRASRTAGSVPGRTFPTATIQWACAPRTRHGAVRAAPVRTGTQRDACPVRPWKPCGATPTTVTRRPLRVRSRPTTEGSPPKRSRQMPWPRIVTRAAPSSSSSVVKNRPAAGARPRIPRYSGVMNSAERRVASPAPVRVRFLTA